VKTVGKQGVPRDRRRRDVVATPVAVIRDSALLEYRATAITGVASSVLDEKVYEIRVVAPMLPPRFLDQTVTIAAENRR